MLLKSSTTALIFGNHDLNIVVDQHADGCKIDLPEHGFHETSSQKGHARSGWFLGFHQSAGIGCRGLCDMGLPLEYQRMGEKSQRAQGPRRSHRKIEKFGIPHGECSDSELEFWFEPLCLHMRMAGVLKNVPVLHIGRAHRLAGQAANAFGSVKIRPRIRSDFSLRLLAPQPKPSSWRVVFIPRECISRAGFQTESAVNAAGEKIFFHNRRAHVFKPHCSASTSIHAASWAPDIVLARWRLYQSPPSS